MGRPISGRLLATAASALLLLAVLPGVAHGALGGGATRKTRPNKAHRGDGGNAPQAMGSVTECPLAKSARSEHLCEAGDLLMSQRRPDSARSCYLKATQLKSGDAIAWHGLGAAYAGEGDHTNAVLSFRKALRLSPEFEMAHVNMGNSLKALGDFAKAAASYHTALKIKPDYAPAYHNLGGLYHVQGNINKALSMYEESVRVQPTFTKAYSKLGRLYHEAGRLDEAAAAYRQVLNLTEDGSMERARAHVQLGDVYRTVGDGAGASTQYKTASEIAPAMPEAHAGAAATSLAQGHPEDAVIHFMTALNLAPKGSPAERHMKLGLARAETAAGRPEVSIKLYNEILEEEPSHPQARSLLGSALFMLAGTRGRGGAGGGGGQAKNPSDVADAEALAGGAGGAGSWGTLSAAADAFRAALDQDANNAAAYTDLGLVLAAQGRLRESLEAHATAYRLEPQSVNAIFHLAGTHHKLGEFVQAQALYKSALSLRPKDSMTFTNLGSVLFDRGQMRLAQDHFKQAVSLMPSNHQAMVNWGNVHLANGELAKAVKLFQQALSVAPQSMEALGAMLKCSGAMARWHGLDTLITRVVRARVEGGKVPSLPAVLAMPVDAAEVRAAAEANAEHLLETVQHATPRDAVTWEGHPAARGGGGKLRVGYLGADVYRNVSSLMGLLREHDKSKVEVFCYLLAPASELEQATASGELLTAVCDHVDVFVEGMGTAVEAATSIAVEHGVQVLVDVSRPPAGGTAHLLALQPAPVQVAFTVEAQRPTTGAPWMQYLVADRAAAPPSAVQFLSERPVMLRPAWPRPAGGHPEDGEGKAAARAALGLPSGGEDVILAVAADGALSREAFHTWTAVLRRVPTAFLAVVGAPVDMHYTLQREVEAAGISRKRILFPAPHPSNSSAVLRVLQLADVALLSPGAAAAPVGSPPGVEPHVAASDVIESGAVPVALASDHIGQRAGVVASAALGVRGIVSGSLREYEERLVELARGADARAAALEELRAASRAHAEERERRMGAAGGLECAMLLMWELYLAGAPHGAILTTC